MTRSNVSSVPDPDPDESSASDDPAEDSRAMAPGYDGGTVFTPPTAASDRGCRLNSVGYAGGGKTLWLLSSTGDDSAS